MSSCAIVSCVVGVSESNLAKRFLLIREAFVLAFELCGCFRSFNNLIFPRATSDSSLFRCFDPSDEFVVPPGQIQ